MLKKELYPASQRGSADYGWLKTFYSFSFANYYNPSRIHFGMLRVINDDIISPGHGFDTHPHENMEIITIPCSGELEHQDSMGHISIIKAGEVQVMSAGTGITHSEFNHSQTNELSLFQIWIIPESRNIQPCYDQKLFQPEERKNKLQLLVSPVGTEGPLHIHQNAFISRIDAGKEQEFDYSFFEPSNGLYVMVVDGEIEIDGITLRKRDAVGIISDSSISLKSNQPADILFFEVPMN